MILREPKDVLQKGSNGCNEMWFLRTQSSKKKTRLLCSGDGHWQNIYLRSATLQMFRVVNSGQAAGDEARRIRHLKDFFKENLCFVSGIERRARDGCLRCFLYAIIFINTEDFCVTDRSEQTFTAPRWHLLDWWCPDLLLAPPSGWYFSFLLMHLMSWPGSYISCVMKLS